MAAAATAREHGVLQPITAIRTDAGVEVRDGHWLGTVRAKARAKVP
jgi:hypothetical protein